MQSTTREPRVWLVAFICMAALVSLQSLTAQRVGAPLASVDLGDLDK